MLQSLIRRIMKKFQNLRIMDHGHGAHETSNLASQDFISNMPDIVVTKILDRLLLKDAVRTSILSRNWRYKWTMLSEIEFDNDFFDSFKTNSANIYGRAITRLLFQLKGTITVFTLYMDEYTVLDDEDINRWILFLSRRGIKDLSIMKMGEPQFELHTHLFSCLELKLLVLSGCYLDPPSSFHGFPNLLNLELCNVQFESGTFGELFTQCPVLEHLGMEYTSCSCELKLDEIVKLTNLKKLLLYLSNVHNTMITSSSSIYELVGFLPKLRVLHLEISRWELIEGDAKKRFPTTYPCLECLTLSTMDIGNVSISSCAFDLIRSFPNLETIEIKAYGRDAGPPSTTCSQEVDYSMTGVLQLRSVVFTNVTVSQDEVYLIKYLLACSPFLKEITIRLHSGLSSHEKFMFTTKLLKLHRASPVAEINID